MGSQQEIVERLTQWFRRSQRQLPWRLSSDPYPIWISEVMLQQTQVATVIPYFQRFLKAFPTLQKLAQASEESVLTQWAGLGYYSRGRNLRRGAQYLLDHHRGVFPKSREELLKVPGIGPYTAGAILSIAFNLKEPLVDGNVERVLSRLFGFKKPLGTTEAKHFFWDKAHQLVSHAKDPKCFNQGLMELGSTVCTKSNPRCPKCPLQKFCLAYSHDLTHELPVPKKRKTTQFVRLLKLILERNGKIWVRQNSSQEWWAGLWDLPSLQLSPHEEWLPILEKKLNPSSPVFLKELSHQKHTVTHHKLEVIPIHLRVRKNPDFDGKWLELKRFSAMPTSALVKKIMLELN